MAKKMNRTAAALAALAGAAALATSASAQQLTTTFVSNNQFAGNTFDLEAFRPITVIGFATNLTNAGSNNTITMWVRPGTAAGFENSAAGWNLFGADTGVLSAGQDNASSVLFSGLEFNPNQTRGVYWDLTNYSAAGTALRYTDGSTTFSNSSLGFTPFVGKGNPAFTGLTFPNRIWNGQIRYKPSASVGNLETAFNTNNSFAGNTFNVVASEPVTITSFDVNLDNPGSNNTVAVYYRLGPAQGNEGNPAAWILLGRDTSVTSAGTNQPSRVQVGGLALAVGQVYGFYVDLESYASPGTSLLYTNGTNVTFSNEDLKIVSNSGQGNPAFTGSLFPGRVWNGRINYAPAATVAGLESTFASGNGQAAVLFDLVASRDIEVHGFDVAYFAGGGGPNTATVWWREGTSATAAQSPVGWNNLGSAQIVNNGAGVATPLRVGGLRMRAGQLYGIAIALDAPTVNLAYTNGANSYSDGILQLNSTVGASVPLFTGTTGVFTPRTFNGRVYYTLAYCYANCDGSTSTPLLTPADFVCYLNRFRAGSAYANCDGSTATPALTPADFVCFLNKFRAGCP